MDEKRLEEAMQLIFIAGNAKTQAMKAILKAEEGDAVEAEAMLQQAKKELHGAHAIQTNWLTSEMNDTEVEKSILLIHSQDHFMAATTTIDMAERFCVLYKKLEVN
ncbi:MULTISPECIES: PTS lactose/cellobiose transporter subunit IIA [Listeria]|uniref:PTS lactose/cellobiose transporter subunit IIA n=1 Tax=Listeria TaxID=1637 RepID=UPI000B58E240|nr:MULTISPECIES: PTS lactose/cellobiose transporter subunit IIA [Listeria]